MAKLFESISSIENAIKARDPKASVEWRSLYYEALKYALTPADVQNMTFTDLVEFVGQKRRFYATQNYKKFTDLEKCCLAWAGRDGLSGNMQDFLSNWNEENNHYYSKDMLKRALKNMKEKGLIEKQGRFWKPKRAT